MRTLERTLGIELFDRRRQRLTLTPAGVDFLVEARRLLAHADRVGSLAPGTHHRAAPLTVGLVDGIADVGWFADSIARFVESHPTVRIDIDSSMRSPELFTALEDGLIDVALTYRAPKADSRLDGQLVDEEPLVLAVPDGHPLAADTDEPISPQSLHGERLILMSHLRSLTGYTEIVSSVERCGVRPDVHVTVSDPRSVLGLVRAGAGIGFVRAGSFVEGSGVVLRRPPVGIAVTVGIYLTTARGERPVARTYRSNVMYSRGPVGRDGG